MQTEELVRLIVQEVLKRIAQPGPRPCVRVLAPRSSALADRVSALVDPWYGSGTELCFSGESCTGKEVKTSIVPLLSCTDMADLASGRAGSGTASEVLSALLRAERVDVLEFEYQRYAQSAPHALYALYSGYEKTLAGFGLKLFRAKKSEMVRTPKELVTAGMLEELGQGEVRALKVGASAKVTPLAQETAARLGISIVRED